MAFFHLTVKQVSRSTGRSSVAGMCYRTGTAAENLYDGVKHDYTRKGYISCTETVLPDYVLAVKPEYKDPAVLWNSLELAETKSDARLFTEVEIALPSELTLSQQVELVKDFVDKHLVSQGRCCTWAIHNPPLRDDLNRPIGRDGEVLVNPDDYIYQNPHCHIMATARPINQSGKWEQKSQIEYRCKRDQEEKSFIASEFKKAKSEGWEKQYRYCNPGGKETFWYTQAEAMEKGLDLSNRVSRQPKTSPYGRQNKTIQYWSSKDRIYEWRQGWEDVCNEHLKKAGLFDRIDSRSFEAQGRSEQLPSVHLGYEATAMERRRQRLIREGADPKSITKTDKQLYNDTVQAHNDAVFKQKHSQKVVIKKLQTVSNRMNTLKTSGATLSSVASGLAQSAIQASNNAQHQENDIHSAEQMMSTINQLNNASLLLIEKLLEQLAKLSMIQLPEKKKIKNQIDAERHKIDDRNKYYEHISTQVKNIDRQSAVDELQNATANYNKVKNQLDQVLLEYQKIDDTVPAEYKNELNSILDENNTLDSVVKANTTNINK